MSEKTHLENSKKTVLKPGTQPLESDIDSTMMFLDEDIEKKIVGWLVLLSPDLGKSHQFSDFPIFQGKNLIGTHEICHIQMPYAPHISRIHGSIRYIDQQFIYTDCDSDQGSFINYQTVIQSALQDNDIIGLGTLKFKFKCFTD